MSKVSFQEEFVKQMMLDGLQKYRDHVANKITFRMRGGSTDAAHGCFVSTQNTIKILDNNIKRVRRGIEDNV